MILTITLNPVIDISASLHQVQPDRKLPKPGAGPCRLQDTEHLFDQMKIEQEIYLARH